jgi:probable rRNA maturation factor
MLVVEVQYAVKAPSLPSRAQLSDWARAAWRDAARDAQLLIRIAGESESRRLNHRYRGRDHPTNVLSFPFDPLPELDLDHAGDLVICAAVVEREAVEQGKPPVAHWAHMVVHGVLHLQGYDHATDRQAEEMESLETMILDRLGYPPPYAADPAP